MGCPETILEIPPVFGNTTAEIEEEIKRVACEFFGSDVKLQLPREYHAKLSSDQFSDSKRFVVEGLTVQRRPSDWRNTVQRSVDLPPASGDSATEVEAEVGRLAIEFFGSDTRITFRSRNCKVQVVPDAKGGKKYKVEGVHVMQTAEWADA